MELIDAIIKYTKLCESYGLETSPSDTITAVKMLSNVDIGNFDVFRETLFSVYAKREEDLPICKKAFKEIFGVSVDDYEKLMEKRESGNKLNSIEKKFLETLAQGKNTIEEIQKQTGLAKEKVEKALNTLNDEKLIDIDDQNKISLSEKGTEEIEKQLRIPVIDTLFEKMSKLMSRFSKKNNNRYNKGIKYTQNQIKTRKFLNKMVKILAVIFVLMIVFSIISFIITAVIIPPQMPTNSTSNQTANSGSTILNRPSIFEQLSKYKLSWQMILGMILSAALISYLFNKFSGSKRESYERELSNCAEKECSTDKLANKLANLSPEEAAKEIEKLQKILPREELEKMRNKMMASERIRNLMNPNYFRGTPDKNMQDFIQKLEDNWKNVFDNELDDVLQSRTQLESLIKVLKIKLKPVINKLKTKKKKIYTGYSNKGKIDFRKTIRKSIQTGGVIFDLEKKDEKKTEKVVILVDVSGSMSWAFTSVAFITKLLYESTKNATLYFFVKNIRNQTETIATTNSIKELIEVIHNKCRRMHEASNCTRMDCAFKQFYENAPLDRDTVVMLLTDCYDDGEHKYNNSTHSYEFESTIWLKKIKEKVKQVVILNPNYPTVDYPAKTWAEMVKMVRCRQPSQFVDSLIRAFK